jgi:hypothetical protein
MEPKEIWLLSTVELLHDEDEKAYIHESNAQAPHGWCHLMRANLDKCPR